MLRRTFLAGTVALAVKGATSLGTLAYVDGNSLWLRDLPDGTPRRLATGSGIAAPKFSPEGGWISYREGKDHQAAWIVSRDGKRRKRDASAQQSAALSDMTIDEGRRHYAFTSSRPNGEYPDGVKKSKTTLLLGSFGQQGEPRRLDETDGFFEIAGFTRSGEWLIYWMSPEMSASIEADGLNLYAVNTRGDHPRRLGVVTLVHADTVSFSPSRDMIAATAGLGRETWANKFIALIDLAAARGPNITYITEPSVSAQLPAWSPDGKMLAWCAGRPPSRSAPTLASGEPEQQSIRSRRIWASGIGPGGRSMQLTNDPQYFDEKPLWSHDGSHILFCRTDTHDAKTIWVMRAGGSDARQVAGPLRPSPDFPDPATYWHHGYYGYMDWRALFDWWQG